MTTKHERRKNEIVDALNIVEDKIARLIVDLWLMPTKTPAQLRRVAEKTDTLKILQDRSDELTDKLNALADTE